MSAKQPNPTDKHVGSRIRMRRLMLGMSQTGLGDQVALTFQQIQKYEKGTNRVGASRLQEFAHILQVPVSFFFEGAPQAAGAGPHGGHDGSPAYINDFRTSTDGLALVKAFVRIKNPALRRSIVHMVESIAR